MVSHRMRHTKHYFRALILLAGAGLGFFLFRAFMIPASFGKFGHYRADNVAEQRQKPLRHAPQQTCADCHAEQFQQHQSAKHAAVPCQDCHAPLADHIDLEKGEMVGAMPIQRTSKLCLRCHRKLPSRPREFPQIDLEDHLAGVAPPHPPEICLSCHSPHQPKPKLRRKRKWTGGTS